MKYFELSPFGTNKLVHLLSDFWIYQKYPSTFDVQGSCFNRGAWREGWRFVCVRACMCVSCSKLPHYLFVFEFCLLKLDFRLQKQSGIWKKNIWMKWNISSPVTNVTRAAFAFQFTLRDAELGSQSWEGFPYLLAVPKFKVALKDLLCVTVWKIP